MPQLPLSLSSSIIAKLDKIAENNNKELIDNGEEPTIRASTVAARIVKIWFEKGDKNDKRTDIIEGSKELEKEGAIRLLRYHQGLRNTKIERLRRELAQTVSEYDAIYNEIGRREKEVEN